MNMTNEKPRPNKEEKDMGWYRWRPGLGKDNAWIYKDLLQAVAEFQPVPKGPGEKAREWLQEEAIKDYPASATWVYLDNQRIEGFFSICSGSFRVGERAIRDRLPRGGTLKPASEILWLCKHVDAVKHGDWFLGRAVSVAREVARIQGNIALVINPYDADTAKMLRSKHAFLEEGKSGRLWVPLPVPIPL